MLNGRKAGVDTGCGHVREEERECGTLEFSCVGVGSHLCVGGSDEMGWMVGYKKRDKGGVWGVQGAVRGCQQNCGRRLDWLHR